MKIGRLAQQPILVVQAAVLYSVVVSAATSNVDEAALKRASECNRNRGTLDFVLLENEAVNAAVEDDIRADLAKIGFTVQARYLTKEEINVARQDGTFHFSITETWGTPYDPHTFATGWINGTGGEGVYPAMANFDGDATREELFDMITDATQEEDEAALQSKWTQIHKYYHAQAVMLPLWGKRVPTLLNTRLTGYQAGFQQFDYPVHKLVPLTGSTTVTIAPGARSGLFKTVGGLEAHSYGPNEFFSSNWVYEGLVSYGQGGQVLPSLAKSWTVAGNDIGGDTYTFQLRENVKFHDGSTWDCAVAKLNFDHLFAGNLNTVKHGWYGVGLHTYDWTCNGDMEFVIRTNVKHGPYLQELTFIRPIRMISPKSFVNGNSTDHHEANSCKLDWGEIDGADLAENVTCAGINGPYGTGPFVFASRVTENVTTEDGTITAVDKRVTFTANADYWDGAPAVQQLDVVYYDSSASVKSALLNGDLDVVWGSGVLSDADIAEIQKSVEYQKSIRVFLGDDLQNVILLLNSGTMHCSCCCFVCFCRFY
jgi:ABC-type transport system substrate-binding protein